ncbi:hypothetical protein EVAR_78492_1 [Eumeta japonica]|uniref:Uncharacterized protein n=1 Tax=Eumeta variegata TaxID=151549 RepID=A0A4C1TY75_EUMVA|nr:hypothetical protein EVAR_78492_1 [Eumeta japonica]
MSHTEFDVPSLNLFQKLIMRSTRPILFALKPKVDEALDKLVSLGILKPVEYADFDNARTETERHTQNLS